MPFHLPPGRRAIVRATACALVASCGCIATPSRFVAKRAPAPIDVAREAARAPSPARAAAPAPGAAPAPAAPRSLADLVDLALSQDPATRAAWYDARAAAATAGSRRSLYLPAIDVGGTLTRQNPGKFPGVPSRPTTSTYGASASITWILLDLGGRGALVDEAERLLAAARLAEHAAVADLVLRVEQTYYQYLGARALVDAETATVKQAETSVEAAEGRRRAGIATIADVLQTRTALSQAQLTLQQLEGQALALRGALATLAGLPPTAPLDVGALPAQVDVATAQPAVEDLLAAAEARSPELARARALADAAGARARAASRAFAPVLGVQGSAGWSEFLDPSSLGSSTTWTGTAFLRIPTFQGLSPAYDYITARANADAARERAGATEQGVALGVWTTFQGVRTAARSVETSRDLLASAQASAEVATGRYKEGVGSILDLLTAQAALESARGQEVRSRADFLVSLAQLARATGRLELPHTPPSAPAPAEGPTQP